jgi:CBS domain-containing protein
VIAKNILTSDILPLRPTDTAAQAMTMMSIYRVGDLPVVEDGRLLGMVGEDQVNSVDVNSEMSSFRLGQSYIYASDTEHIFEILGKLAENRISVIPVLDNNEQYLGMITQEALLQYYANTYSFKEVGSIVVIKVLKNEYSLSEMTRVIEMEGATILASFISTVPDSNHLLVTLKINQHEISTILAALERYEYDIHATFAEDEYTSDLKSRYDLLMTYLNV